MAADSIFIHIGHKIFPTGEIDRSFIAHNQTHGDECLRCDAIAVILLIITIQCTNCGIAQAAQ